MCKVEVERRCQLQQKAVREAGFKGVWLYIIVAAGIVHSRLQPS
jgi:hypothetical protein